MILLQDNRPTLRVESIVIKIEDLAVVRSWRSRPIRSIVHIGQGGKDSIPFLQTQGNAKVHFPPHRTECIEGYLEPENFMKMLIKEQI